MEGGMSHGDKVEGTRENTAPHFEKLVPLPVFFWEAHHSFLNLYRHAEGDGEIAGSVARGEAKKDRALDGCEDINEHVAQETIVRIAPGHLTEDNPFDPCQFSRAL